VAYEKKKKLSQGDIENRTGLLRCYISRVENGHTVPAIETLEKMSSPVVCGFDRSERDAESRSLILEHANVSPDLLRVVAAGGENPNCSPRHRSATQTPVSY
jgi:transcriptional regulator with XRE-family HTH domain